MPQKKSLKGVRTGRREALPFKDLIRVSSDGQFVLLDCKRMMNLTDRKFTRFHKFISYAFDNYEELSLFYPLHGTEKIA